MCSDVSSDLVLPIRVSVLCLTDPKNEAKVAKNLYTETCLLDWYDGHFTFEGPCP